MAKSLSNILSVKSISLNKLYESGKKFTEKNNMLIYVNDKIIYAVVGLSESSERDQQQTET